MSSGGISRIPQKTATELADATVTAGGQNKVWTSDVDMTEVLREVLTELKMIRTHLQFMTDEEVEEGDSR